MVPAWQRVRERDWRYMRAEEASLVGSTLYVNTLSDEEFAKIALYLNFDMVGSPNHVFFVQGVAPA
jgi:Zn-dependent M28 family amino/carboxypeptidase